MPGQGHPLPRATSGATRSTSTSRKRPSGIRPRAGGGPIAAASLPQLTGLHLAPLGESAGQPAGGAFLLVVLGRAAGLKYQLDGHQPTLRATGRNTPHMVRD